MSLDIRPAATADSRFVAQMMYDSMLPGVGKGAFDDALEGAGVDPVGFGEALILEGANNWGQLSDFLVLEDAEAGPVAASAAYRSNLADWRPMTPDGFERTAARLGWGPDLSRQVWMAFVRRFGMFGNAPQLKQPADYVIEYIAVEPEHRGRGLGAKLLAAHANRARSEGWKTMGVSAMYGNEPALRAYLKFGFEEAYRLGPEHYRGAYPGMIRLILTL
jgi:GNAT superfamily N-acetyltransferase